jgi:DNA-binding transcriptional regulator YiaG
MTDTRSDWTGDEVKALRDELGMSQGEFGELVGLPTYDGSCPRLSDIENGRRTASGPLCKLLTRIEHERTS